MIVLTSMDLVSRFVLVSAARISESESCTSSELYIIFHAGVMDAAANFATFPPTRAATARAIE